MSNRRQLLKSLALATTASTLLGAHSRAEGAPASKRRIKIGQIGTGHAHANKLSVYRKSDDYEVVGIVEPDPKLRATADKDPVYQGMKWMTESELLATPDLEAVLVETRVRDLLPTAMRCITAGKHVHIDKPAGESLTEFRAILDAAQQRELLVQMGYMYRYNPAIVLLQDLLKRGWLGEIFEVHTVMSKVLPAGDRQELAEYRGGMMFELGCHVLDLVIGILGKPKQVTPYWLHSSHLQDDLRDNSLAVLVYNRALATVKTTCLEIDGGQRRHLVVCGTEGTLHIQPLDNPSARLTLHQDRGSYHKGQQEIKFPTYSRYVGDAADMAAILRKEKPSDFSYEHDWIVQSTLMAACGLS